MPSARACRVEAHAEWQAPDDRPDPVGVLEEQNATRVPDLVPIRHGRMIVSPFTFYRGGAAIMAWDLSRTPTTGLRVQCCGDAHLSNFGVFAAPDRRLVFDLNDFDETLPAPFEWDVKRLVGELRRRRPRQRLPAARSSGPRHARPRPPTGRRWPSSRRCASSTSGTPASTSRTSWIELAPRADKAAIKAAEKNLAKARKRTSLGSLQKFAEEVDGSYRIKQVPPVIVHPPEEFAAEAERIVRQGLADYEGTLTPDRRLVLDHYHFVDFARKVVGVGSVGTEAFMILLMGDRDDDPLFLQVKEANTSVLAPFAGDSEYDHQGERVVQGQRVDAGRERRLPRLGHRNRRRSTASSTCASCAT